MTVGKFAYYGPEKKTGSWSSDDNSKSSEDEIKYNLADKPDGTYDVYATINTRGLRWEVKINGGVVVSLESIQGLYFRK